MSFFEAFLLDGLFVGYSLPDGFLADLIFRVIERQAICDAGQVLIGSMCFMCPRGTFLNETKNCELCPVGYYQDMPGRETCVRCAAGSNTHSTGAKDSHECFKLCEAGSYSPTGLDDPRKPCRSCERGYYQPRRENDPQQEVASNIKYSSPIHDILPYSECFHQPCLQLSTCHDLPHGFFCECQLGFTGTFCEQEINECHSFPCRNNGRCSDQIDNYICICAFGWTGRNCEIEVEECVSQPCLNGGSCLDHFGGYECQCQPGYSGVNCQLEIDECFFLPCANNSTCIDLVGGFRCDCLPGYHGRLCELDIDECRSAPCLNGASCSNSWGSFRCECLSGFRGSLCDVNINDCLSNPCQNDGVCEDRTEGYICICQSGYGGQNCDKVLTSDYILTFDGEANSYSRVTVPNNAYTSFSVSFWLKSTRSSNSDTPFSYANYEHANAFTLSDCSRLLLYVNDDLVPTDISLDDQLWHHTAVTWTNQQGMWQVFVDGLSVRTGSSIQVDQSISGGGMFVIGQEQDDLSGTYSSAESFMGQITLLYVWDRILEAEEVYAMYTSCENVPDSLVFWPSFQYAIVDTLMVENSTFCSVTSSAAKKRAVVNE
ncbi:sushi, von Willebrand factor type A, EGF and pentraxin domain-containing protein 1-like [Watersipora subatra]|uniref:sushi, von Willebrand factor type A, EGF and pentraxin domain-containing protein 1-like n=1 Tax=Watersipora subatra TaxID=2589382 RepID=UPI00355ADAA9